MRKNYLLKAAVPVIMAVIIALGLFAVAFSATDFETDKGGSTGDALNRDYASITDWVDVGRHNATEATPAQVDGVYVIKTAGEFHWMMNKSWATAYNCRLAANFNIVDDVFYRNTFKSNLSGKNIDPAVNNGENFYIKSSYAPEGGINVTMDVGLTFVGGFVGLAEGALTDLNYALTAPITVEITNDNGGASLQDSRSRNAGGFIGMLAGANAKLVNCRIFIDAKFTIRDLTNTAEQTAIRVGLMAGAIASDKNSTPHATTAKTVINRIENCEISVTGDFAYSVPSNNQADQFVYRVYAGLIGELEHSNVVNSVISVNSNYSLSLYNTIGGSDKITGELYSSGFAGKLSGATVLNTEINVNHGSLTLEAWRVAYGGIVSTTQNLLDPQNGNTTYNGDTVTYNVFDKDKISVNVGYGTIIAWGGSGLGQIVGGFAAVFGQNLTFKNSSFAVNDLPFRFHDNGKVGEKAFSMFAARMIGGNGTTDPKITIQNAAIDFTSKTPNFDYANIAPGEASGTTSDKSTWSNSGLLIGKSASGHEDKSEISDIWILKNEASIHKIFGGKVAENSALSSAFQKLNYIYYDRSDGYFDVTFNESTNGLNIAPVKNGASGTYFYDSNRDSNDVTRVGFTTVNPKNSAFTAENGFVGTQNPSKIAKTFNTTVNNTGAPFSASHPDYYRQWNYSYVTASGETGTELYGLFAMDKLRTIQEINRYADSNNKGYNGAWMKPKLVALEGNNGIITNPGNSAIRPIGTSTFPFQGVFDGNNVTLETLGFSNAAEVGFLGVNSGTIKNLHLTIIGMTGINEQAAVNAGFIAGTNYGTITDVSVKVNAGGITIYNKDTALSSANVGGIVGLNAVQDAKTGVISNTTMTLDGSFTFNVQDAASGAVLNAGGLIGKNASGGRLSGIAVTLKNTNGNRFNTVTAVAALSKNFGGLIGSADASGSAAAYSNIAVVSPVDEKYKNIGDGTTCIGYFIGNADAAFNSNTNVKNVWVLMAKAEAGSGHWIVGNNQSGGSAVNRIEAGTAENYDAIAELASGFPKFTVSGDAGEVLIGWYDGDTKLGGNEGVNGAVFTSTSAETTGKTYALSFIGGRISNYEDLKRVSDAVYDGVKFEGMTFVLQNDIIVNDANFKPIGTSASKPFSGYFNGNGKTITIQTMANAENAGLFGYIQASPTTKTLQTGTVNVPNAGVYALNVVLSGNIAAASGSAGILAGVVEGAEIGRLTTSTTESVAGATYDVVSTAVLPVTVKFSGASSITGSVNAGAAIGSVSFRRNNNIVINAYVGHITVLGESGATLSVQGTTNASAFIGNIGGAEISAADITADGITLTNATNMAGIAGAITSNAGNLLRNVLIKYGVQPADGVIYTVKNNAEKNAASFSNVWAYLGKNVTPDPSRVPASNNYFNVIGVRIAEQNSSDNVQNVSASLLNIKAGYAQQKNNIQFKTEGAGSLNFAGFIGNTQTGAVLSLTGTYTPDETQRGLFAAAVYADTDIDSAADWENMRWYNDNVSIPITFNVKSAFSLAADYAPIGATEGKPLNLSIKGGSKSITIPTLTYGGDFALFGTVSEYSVLENISVVVNGYVEAKLNDSELKYAAGIAVINNGIINGGKVTINSNPTGLTYGFKGSLVGGAVVTNNGTIDGISIVLNGTIDGGLIGGVAAYNNAAGIIRNAAVSFNAGSVIISTPYGNMPGTDGTTVNAGLIGGVGGVNAGKVYNSKVSLSGSYIASGVGSMFLGGVVGLHAGSGAEIRGFNVTVTTVGTDGGFYSVTSFGGVVYTIREGAKISEEENKENNNNVYISGSSKISKGFGGIAVAMQGTNTAVSNVNVYFQNSENAASSIEADAFAGAVVNLTTGKIWDINIESKSYFTFKGTTIAVGFAGDIGAVEVSKVRIVQEGAIIGVGSSVYTSAFIGYNRSRATVSDSVILIRNRVENETASNLKVALYAASTNTTDGSLGNNVWVIAENEFTAEIAFNPNAIAVDVGVNVLKVVGNATFDASLTMTDGSSVTSTGVVSVGVTANGILAERLYSAINDRTVYSNAGITVTDRRLTVDCNSISDENLMLHLSLFDLEIDNDAEFAVFAQITKESHFKGVKFNLNADVAIADTIIGANTPFEGILEGNKHKIDFSGNMVGTDSGLFGAIGKYGEVRNLIINVKAGSVIGGAVTQYAGGFAGYVDGKIKNVAVNFANAQDAASRVRLGVSPSGNAGVLAGGAGGNAEFTNIWSVSLMNEYDAVGSDPESVVNYIGVLGWQNVEVSFATDSSILIFSAPLEGKDGWYTNYSQKAAIPQKGTGSFGQVDEAPITKFYANTGAAKARNTLSYFNPEISNQQQLIDLSAFITLLPNVQLNITLANDIILGEGYTQQSFLDFHPIGSSANPFRGSFDGRGHTITITDSVLINSEYSGLFGVADATINNLILRVESPYIGNDGSAASGMLVGSLLGGNPSNIVVEMNVKQLNVKPENMGGIIGNYASNFATNNVWLITNDYNINPTQNSTQTDKFNIIYALNDASVDSPVTPENPNGTDVVSNGSVTVTDFGTESITLASVGDFHGFVIDDVYCPDSTKTIDGIAAFSGKKYYSIAFKTAISTLEELEYLAARIADTAARGALNIAGVRYTLTADITVDGAVGAVKSFQPIGGIDAAFNGTFDGCGHTIVFGENSQIISANAGLFGATGNKSSIENLIIDHKGVIDGSSTAGTVVGRSNGSIKNVVVKYEAKSFRENSGTTVRVVGGGGIGAIGSVFENVWLIRENNKDSYSIVPGGDVNYMLLVGQNVANITAVIGADGIITFTSNAATTDSYNWYSKLAKDGTHTIGEFAPAKDLTKQLYYGSTYKLNVSDVASLNKINGYLEDALANGFDLTGVTFFQTADIALGSGFVPVGSTYRTVAGVNKLAEFYSVYDGEGYSITIDQNIKALAALGDTRTYAGIFGVISAQGTVKNLLVNLNAEIFAENNNAGALSYAGVIAYNKGTLHDVVIKVGVNGSVKAVPALHNLLPTVSVTAGFTNKDSLKNVWVLQSTRNVLSASAIKDSGVNTLTMIGSPDNVSVSFTNGAISFAISGTLYSDYTSGALYGAADYVNSVFAPSAFSNKVLQAVSVKTAIENENDLAQLAFDVNAGYVMKETYTVSTEITVTGAGFVESIGDIANNAVFGGSMTFSGNGKIVNGSGLPLFGYISAEGKINNPVYQSTGNFALAYSSGSGTFAVVNDGVVTNGSFTSDASITGERFGVVFGKNNGTVTGGSVTYTGTAVGKEIAAFVFDNRGVIQNIEVNMNGTLSAESTVSGDTVSSAFAVRNGGTVQDITVLIAGIMKAKGIASEYMTGLVSTNSGYIDTVNITFENGSTIGTGVGTVFGIARDNQNDGTTFGTHNASVYYKQNAAINTEYVYAVGSGNGRFNNTWVLAYEQYQNTNGQNLIVISGTAEITAKFNASHQFEIAFTPAIGFATSGLFNGNVNLLGDGVSEYAFTNTTLQGEEYGLMFLKNLLENESDLRNFASQVNSGMKIGVEVKLKNNITITGAGFEPIGKNETHPFVGSFNGDGYTVTIAANVGGTYAGLFGYVGAGGSVKGVHVTLASGFTIGGTNTVYAGALAAWVSSAQIGVSDRNSKMNFVINGSIKAQNDAGGAIGRVDGSHVENINIAIGSTDGLSGSISAKHAGGAIGDTKLITGLTNQLNNAVVNLYAGFEVYGSEFAGGIVGRSYIDIKGIYIVNRGVIRGATAGLIIGKNVGKIAETFAMDYVGGLRALGNYGNLSTDLTDIWAIVCGELPPMEGDIVNYVSMDKALLEKAYFDFADHGSITIPLDTNGDANNTKFTVWQQNASATLDITGVVGNKYTLPNGVAVKGLFITVKAVDTITDLYDLRYFAAKIAPLTTSGETFEHLVTTGVKLGADLDIASTSGYSAFAMPVPFDGQGHKITLDSISLFTTAKTVSNLIVESNLASGIIASGAVDSLDNIVGIVNHSSPAADVTLFAASSALSQRLATITYVKDYNNTETGLDHRVVGARGNMIVAYLNGHFSVSADTAAQGDVEFVSQNVPQEGLHSYYFVKTTIDSEDDLKAIAELNAANQSTENKSFTFTADIALTTQISGLKGAFNGAGHSVTYHNGTAFAEAFTSFEGTLNNIVISGLNVTAEKNAVLSNALILTDKFDGSAVTITNNVWTFVETLPETRVAALNYLVGANVSNTDYAATYANGNAVFTFQAKGTEAEGKIFGGFERSGIVSKTLTTSATDAASAAVRRSINSVLTTLEDWDKMAQAANAGVYTNADTFNLGADIAVQNALFVQSFDMNLNGQGFKLNVEGRAANTKLANVKGNWSNVVFVGNYQGTIVDIEETNSVDNWAVNSLVNLKGINRVTGDGIKFRYNAEAETLTVYVENNTNLIKTTVNNSAYTADYAAFTAKNSARYVSNRVDFALLSGNRITNADEFALYAKGNGSLASGAIVELAADITTDIASITNKIHFNGNGHTVSAADGVSMTFINEGYVNALALRGASVTFSSNGSSYGDSNAAVTAATAEVRTTDLLIIKSDKAIFVNEKITGEGEAAALTAETQNVTLENAAGANIAASYVNGTFELVAGINAQKTSMFIGYQNAGGTYVDVAKFVFGDTANTVTKLVFANPTVSTLAEYNGLISKLNDTASVAENRQPYIVNITAGFEGSISPLIVSAEVLGNYNKVVHSAANNLFGDTFGGRVENLMVETNSSVVIGTENKAVLNNVWILKNGAAPSSLHPQLGVLSMNNKDNTITLAVSEKNGAFGIDITFTEGAGKNMARWSDGASAYVEATSYALPRKAKKISVDFVSVTKIKLTFDDLEIRPLDKEYDGTNELDYALVIKNSTYGSVELTGKNLKLVTNKVAVGTGYAVNIVNSGEVYFGSVENSVVTANTYYINASEFEGRLGTVNINKRRVTLQFTPQTEIYTDASAKDANNILKSRVFGINDPALKALISSDLGSGKNWYDAVSGTIKLRGADGIIYDATSKLPNQDYFLVADSVNLSGILSGNYTLDKSVLEAATSFALRYNITGTVKIVQSAPGSISMLNGISDLKNNFFRLEGIGELYGNTAALDEILNRIVYDGSGFLELRDDGKYWVKTTMLGRLLTVNGTVAPNDNYAVTVQPCQIDLKQESYKVTRVGNNSNVYLADVKNPTIEGADSQIFSDATLKTRFNVTIERMTDAALLDVGQYLLKVKIYDTWYDKDVTDFISISFAKDELQYYTVTPCPIVVTLNDINVVYGQTITDWNFDVAVIPAGVDIGLHNAVGITVVGNPEIKDYDVLGKVDAGSYFLTKGTIRLNDSDKLNNYKLEIKTNNAKLHVGKSSLTIEGVGKTVVYGYASLPENEVVFKDALGNVVAAHTLGFADGFIKYVVKTPAGSVIAEDRLVKLDAAEYMIGIELDTADKMYKNYNFSMKPAVLEVTQRPVKVGFAAGKGVYTKEYNQDFEIADSDLVYGPVEGNPESGFLEGEENYCFYDFYDSFDPKFHVWYPDLWYDETIGTTGLYAIEFDDGNYMPDYRTSQVGEITVTKAKITIIVSGGSSKEQGSDDPKFRYSFADGKSVKKEHIYGILSREGGEGVGKYKITEGSLTLDPLYYEIVEWQFADDAVLTINRAANENAMFMILAAVLGVIVGASMLVAGSIIYVKKKKNGGKLPPKKKKVKKSKKGKNEKRENAEAAETENSEAEISAEVTESAEAEAVAEKSDKTKEKRRGKNKKAAKEETPADFAPSAVKDEWSELTGEEAPDSAPAEAAPEAPEAVSVEAADAAAGETAEAEASEVEQPQPKKRGRKKVDE